MNTIDPVLLDEFLICNPLTGELTWKARARHHFKTDWSAKRWNKIYANQPAFTRNLNGYRSGSIHGATLLAHRVIWAMHYGKWPTKFLDHQDGNRSNNAISNLREADHQTNGQNQAVSKASTSGATGVSWNRRNKMWKAYYHINKRQHLIGYFHNLDEAITAQQAAVAAMGFHPNHGRKT